MGKLGSPDGMTYATKAQIRDWPPPNYVNPESRKPLVIGIEVSVTVLAALVLVARFYARTFIKRVLGWDDWLMLGAMTCAATVTILHCLCTQYATGLHLWDIKPSWIKPTGMLTYTSLVFFAPTASLAKISISLTHLRILPSRSDRIFAICAIIFSVGYCISITLVTVFQCWPIHSYWTWKIQSYKCIQERPFNYSAQALNSASDFLIFLWPCRTLWTVRIPIRQRLILVFVFSVGCIVCIVGVFRIYYLYRYFHFYDIYWEGAIIFILHCVETNLAIICGCLPGIKPLLARIFPNTFGSSGDGSRPSNMSFTRFSHRRLPGARLSLREPVHSLTHRPSEASMVEVPIKLDHNWGSGTKYPEAPPVAHMYPGAERKVYLSTHDPHPGRRVSGC